MLSIWQTLLKDLKETHQVHFNLFNCVILERSKWRCVDFNSYYVYLVELAEKSVHVVDNWEDFAPIPLVNKEEW